MERYGRMVVSQFEIETLGRYREGVWLVVRFKDDS